MIAVAVGEVEPGLGRDLDGRDGPEALDPHRGGREGERRRHQWIGHVRQVEAGVPDQDVDDERQAQQHGRREPHLKWYAQPLDERQQPVADGDVRDGRGDQGG